MRKFFLSNRLFFFALSLLSLLLILYLTAPNSANEEYRYTIKQLFFYFTLPGFWLLLIYCLYKLFDFSKIACVFGILGYAFVIPLVYPNFLQTYWAWSVVYSSLWITGTLSLGLFCFFLLSKSNTVLSSVLSVVGTLFLSWGAMELWYLSTNQRLDGMRDISSESKYIKNDEAQIGFNYVEKKSGLYPVQPRHPSHSVAHYEQRYEIPHFDVRYTLDEHGHRVVAINSDEPKADLMLFGCSFTFGYGLENEQTWAWKLSEDLGPEWRVTNFGFNGFGAQQMLGLLEEHELEPVPKAKKREALFLGIRPHIYRYTGLFQYKYRSLKYKLDNNHLERDGYTADSPLQIIPWLPKFFKGSQAVREIANKFLSGYEERNQKDLLTTYAAIINKASKLLKEEYNANLTVLLWPDLEDLAPMLEKEGTPVLFAAQFLKSWKDGENNSHYHIVPEYEPHPNEKATEELASGLAEYYRAILSKS